MSVNKSGFIKVPGGKVWYKIAGKKCDKAPVILLHGGPGYPHNYLTSVAGLSDERRVIFYDQLGCGKSKCRDNRKLWNVRRFVRELGNVVKTLGSEGYHLLGHSWGAALAASFAVMKPKGLLSLVLADPFLSTKIWMKDIKRLIDTLPENHRHAINDFIKDRKDSEMHAAARAVFYDKFERRFKKKPRPILQSEAGTNHKLYKYMWGPEEYFVTGVLKKFDLMPKLSKINVPVLLICGRFDEVTPESALKFKKKFVNAELAIFEKSAHFPHLTEKVRYLKVLRLFLLKAESRFDGLQ